jgi:VanZ family protein
MRPVFFTKPRKLPLRQDEEIGWRWRFAVWAPVVVAIAVICVESTGTFSSQNTSSWLRPIAERWFGVFTESAWEFSHHFLRKSGHFIGYGTVGFMFLRAWLYTLDRRGPSTLLSWRLESSILAIFSTAIVASCDEFHQTFLPSRTGTPIDVLLDSAGAFAMCVLVWLICWSQRTRNQYL